MIANSEILIRLLLGALIGGIVGFERQSHGRPAGFRTHLIVCLAGVLIMVVSQQYYYLSFQNPAFIRIDPVRLAAGAITGVGFLGAGVIIKYGFSVQGLTTAACLWIVSIIGLAIGSGLYFAGAVASAITVFSLWALRRLEKSMASLTYKNIVITAETLDREEEVVGVLDKMKIYIRTVDYEVIPGSNEAHFHMTVSYRNEIQIRDLVSKLSSLGGVKKVSVKG
jgi:putative Mg2+ transporter-C (MgtC) family protein